MNWQDKRVFITGGASGLGRALATTLSAFVDPVPLAERVSR